MRFFYGRQYILQRATKPLWEAGSHSGVVVRAGPVNGVFGESARGHHVVASAGRATILVLTTAMRMSPANSQNPATR